ncbi:MAG: hypothetical protein J7574_12310 [Flavobacterium sp.]|uniref:hypothetical protein n=1 Tax=Flavobacterium sp. TaxID=239 RepID=UPI001AFD7E5B|nr:hypothetical protein [Flavobacterium sp.]MBO9584934.1 hypothetical protein [Flavobacterium sp.]
MKKVILVIVCLFLFSCEQITKSIDDTLKPNDSVAEKEIENTPSVSVQSEKTATNLLTDIPTLKKAEEELKKLPQYKGKKMFVYSMLYFYNDGRINALLQHPENPKYIDTYEFKDGKWSEPIPLQVSIRDDIKGRLVSLNKISFANAAKVAQIYNEKAEEVEGAQPTTSVYISIWKNEVKWYPTTINGSRERYLIQFNEDGSLKEFKQD